MKFSNWKLDRIQKILASEFFDLIHKNRNHINKTFPVTVSNCIDLEKTNEFIAKNILIEKQKTRYFFYIRNLETNNLIGYLGIKKIDYVISKCELFYFIDKDYEGKGIISKAILDAIDFCFKELKCRFQFVSKFQSKKNSNRNHH